MKITKEAQTHTHRHTHTHTYTYTQQNTTAVVVAGPNTRYSSLAHAHIYTYTVHPTILKHIQAAGSGNTPCSRQILASRLRASLSQ